MCVKSCVYVSSYVVYVCMCVYVLCVCIIIIRAMMSSLCGSGKNMWQKYVRVCYSVRGVWVCADMGVCIYEFMYVCMRVRVACMICKYVYVVCCVCVIMSNLCVCM